MKKYPCDFYLCTGHGVGRLSFSMYLHSLGLSAQTYGQFWKNHPDRQAKVLAEMEKFRLLGSPYVGLTIDCLMTEAPGSHLLSSPAPVFLLVQDPVNLFTSFMNHFNRESYRFIYYNNNVLHHVQYLDLDEMLEMFLSYPAEFYKFNTLLKCVLNPTDIRVIDTADILPDKIMATMKTATSGFRIGRIEDRRECLSVAYGSFKVQTLMLCPSLTLKPKRGAPVKVGFYPEHVWRLKKYMECLIDWVHLGRVGSGGLFYEAVTQDRIEGLDLTGLLTGDNLAEIEKHLEAVWAVSEFLDGLRKGFDFTPEQVAEAIRKKESFRAQFRRLWETEWAPVDKYKTGHTRRWEHALYVIN